MDLLTEIRSLHQAARSRTAVALSKREAAWLRKERRIAEILIARLPEKLKSAAEKGKFSLGIYQWTDPRRGFLHNLEGVPALIQNWCKKNGIKVTSSVQHSPGPKTGSLTVYLYDL